MKINLNYQNHVTFEDVDTSWIISGLAVPANAETKDRYPNFKFKSGAFAKIIKDFNDGLIKKIVILPSHESNAIPLGRVTHLSEDAAGLHFEAKLEKGLADKYALAIKAGLMDSVSVGIEFKVDRKDANKELVEVAEVESLHEISLVNFPALSGAGITDKNFKITNELIESSDKIRSELDAVNAALSNLKSVRNIEKHLKNLGISSKDAKTIVSSLRNNQRDVD